MDTIPSGSLQPAKETVWRDLSSSRGLAPSGLEWCRQPQWQNQGCRAWQTAEGSLIGSSGHKRGKKLSESAFCFWEGLHSFLFAEACSFTGGSCFSLQCFLDVSTLQHIGFFCVDCGRVNGSALKKVPARLVHQ